MPRIEPTTGMTNPDTATAGFDAALLRVATGFAFDVISVIDGAGQVIYNSDSIQEVLGRPPLDNLGSAGMALVHPDDRAQVIRVMSRLRHPGSLTGVVEYRLMGPTGSWRVVESRAVNRRDDPDIAGIVVITRDVTEQRRHEALRIASTDVLNSIALGESLHHSLLRLIEALTVHFGATGAAVLVREADGQDIRVLKSIGVPADWEEALSESLDGGRGTPGWDGSAPAATSSLTTDPAWSGYAGPARSAGLESCWSAPMIESTSGAHMGVVEIYFAEERTVGPSDLSDLEGLARLAGLAIERDRANRRLAYSSLYDSLTNLPNRELFLDRLKEAITRSHRAGTALAVLSIDIDNMKDHNDRLGPGQGDVLLARAALSLEEAAEGAATAARVGGDEFALLYEGVESADDALALGARVINCLRGAGIDIGAPSEVTASIGITLAASLGPNDTPESIFRQAEVALVQAKRAGGGRQHMYDVEMQAEALGQSRAVADLRHAIRTGQLALHYQPEFDLHNGRLLGVEALVRWDHPERGSVPAMEIIELAEKSDLIGELGSWVLRQACSQAAAWDRGSIQDRFKIWINLSQSQLSEPGLVREIVAALADAGVAATSIGVEITETVLLADPVAAGKCIQALRSLGLEVALDDFGTGYSSLSFLRRFPVDVVKIDGSFVAGLGQNQQDAAIVYSIVSMGHSLGLVVVAEGVETQTQRLELEMLGCDRVQGWLYSPALPPDEIEAWMNRYDEAWAQNAKPRQVRSYSALRPSGPEPRPRGRIFPWIGTTPALEMASIMRVTAWLFGACGALALVSPQLPLDHVSALGMESVGLVSMAVGLAVRLLPWQRWPRAVTLALVPTAFALIAAYNYFGGGDAYRYGVFFTLLYVWMGMALPRWASTATVPILAGAYIIPLEASHRGGAAAWSFVYVALICVLISEVVAWSLSQFGSSQVTLDQEQRWSQSLMRYSNDLICALEDHGQVIFASFASERLVGQRPSDLIGTNLFDLIHPDDQATTTDAMDYVRERQGQPLAFDVRLRHRDKSWRWCALTAQNLLDRPGVGAILINASDITERKRTGDLLAFHANHDPLTHLLNRASFNQHLSRALQAARRHQRLVSVLFIDLDGFKNINDSYGHNIGDQLLKEVAHRLSGCLRQEDCLARQGGDEFTAVIEESPGQPGASEVSLRIMEALRPPVDLGTTTVSITASVGISRSDIEENPGADRLTQLADIAMYRAKQLGKDRFYVLSQTDLPVMPI